MLLIILAFCSSLVFLPSLYDSFGLPKLTYLSLLSCFAIIRLWLIFRKAGIYWKETFLFFLYVVVLLLTSPWPLTHEAMAQLSLDLIGISFFIYTVNAVNKDQVRHCIEGSVVVACLILLASVAAWRWPHLIPFNRPFEESTMGNKKYPALIALVNLPLSFYLAGNSPSQWQRVSFTCSATILATYIFLSHSLIALYAPLLLIAGAFFFSCLSWLRPLGRAKLFVAPVVLIGLLASGFLFYRSQPTETRQRLVASISERVEIWKEGVKLGYQAGVFGVGRGNFQLHYPKQQEKYLTTHAHNDYIELYAETGVGGLSIFLALSGLILLRPNLCLVGNYLKASASAILLLALVWFPLSIAPLAVCYWIFLGLIYVDTKTAN